MEENRQNSTIADANAAVRPQAIRERIRRYRTGDLKIRVVDRSGRPVPHAHVSIKMTRSAFLFGCNFFGLDPANDSVEQREYRDRFAALFNFATLPVYWGMFEPEQGKKGYARLDSMVDWCAEHDIVTKAHPLVWHEVYPRWAPSDPDAVIPLLRAQVEEIVGREKNRIRYYDVINEATRGGAFNPPNAVTRWLQRDGDTAVVETAFFWAKQARGDAPDTLIYNDYETGQPNVDLLSALEKDRKLPDAIGIQSHMHTGVWPLEKIWEVCERFARFHRPVHFTETTVISGPQRPMNFSGPPATDWDSTRADEEKQADYVVQFYSVLFSHPSVQAITWWDFSDKGAWMGAPSGLLRKDMSPKPVYDRLLEMIRHDWWTNTAGEAQSDGDYSIRAFYGDYEVDVDDRRGHKVVKTFTFAAGAGHEIVTVTVPNVR